MTSYLSDSDLSKRLLGLGLDVGPITDTTRQVYLRKYKTLVAQQQSPPAALPKGTASQSPPDLPKGAARPALDKHKKEELVKPPAPPPTPTTPPSALNKHKKVKPPAPPPTPTTSPSHAPLLSAQSGQDTPTGTIRVVEQLLSSFDNLGHVSSDTAFLFPTGEVIAASRSILATQCCKMIPILYNGEAPYPLKVITLSGQSSEFMVRAGELVRDLKEKICLMHSIPVPEQRLVFKQQELPDLGSFVSLDISAGATLHLVLVGAEMIPANTVSYTSAGITPTLSIHHFFMGLSPEQLSYLMTPTSPPQSHHVQLPSHITHLVHMHDTLYTGTRMFLGYLYCRKLLQQNRSSQCSDYVMCYILGLYFDVPELMEACLSAVSSCLTVDSARLLLQLSKSICSQSALEQLCMQYLNAHSS